MLLLAAALPVGAQTDRGTITGTITDASGAPLPKAKVQAAAISTGLIREAVTTEAGVYTLAALPIGSYTVTITAPGFEKLETATFELQVGQTKTLDAKLGISGVQTHVDVSDDAPLAETSAVVGGVIAGSQIQNLPVNGRNFNSLMLLVPGAIDSGTSDQKSVRFAGRGVDDTNFRFDGVDATGVQNQGQRTSTRLQMSTEAIAEFRASSALYTAETGGTTGGQVEVVSKAGANNTYGSIFEFLRNDYFDARSFDSKSGSLPPFRLNQYGGSIGGAIVKNRTFYFFNYEGFRQVLGQPLTGLVPSAAYRKQVLAASPVLKPILDAYPVGTAPTSDPNVDTWFGNGRQTASEDAGLARMDHRFNEKTTGFLRFNMDSGTGDVPNGGNGFLLDRLGTTIKPYNAIASVQRVFSPSMLNDAKIGFNRSDFFTGQESVLPYAVTNPSFTTLINPLAKIAVSNSFSFVDNYTWVFGRHTFKAGVEVRRVQINQSATATNDLTVAYASASDFVKNIVSSALLNAAVPITGLRKTSEFGFVQDEFKLRPNLTLNVGLRYEYFSQFHEVNGHAVVFDPKSCAGGFCPPGSDFYFADPYDFAPRVSVAWSPQALHGKTVVRSGYGIYYGEAQLGDLNAPVNNIALRLALTSAGTPGLSFPVDSYLATTTNSLTPRGLDRHRKNQNVQSWGLSVQQEILSETVFEAGYLGTKGTHLFTRSDVNGVNPITGLRPFPALGLVDYKTSDSNSTFHALQLQLRRNFHHGFLVTANYQWSHSINDGSVGGGEALAPENINCRACDRGSSDQDVRQYFASSAVWQIPYAHQLHGFAGKVFDGWELSGIGTARSGRPVNILVTRKAGDLPDQNNANQRPDYVYGAAHIPPQQGPGNWLNPAAYAVPAKGTWGNLGKNTARGPSLWQVDPALTRRIRLTERFRLDFRAEFFNVFNRAQYGDPVASISNPVQFGKIVAPVNTGSTGSGTPRQIQLMLRLNY
jgi:Carboxypeptidase regulatory-like domain/TonB dependent receptor